MSKNIGKDLKEAILGIEVTQFDGQKADLEELVNPKQLEKIISDWMPEVPVVPEDVYEHIKMNKVGGVPLDIALDDAIGILWGDGIQFDEFRNNQDNYARAWLAYPDIEIEEEPLYYVMKDGVVILSKIDEYHQLDKSRWIGAVTNKEYIKENPDKVRFTEQEIKDYDERFWAFAVPVVGVSND